MSKCSLLHFRCGWNTYCTDAVNVFLAKVYNHVIAAGLRRCFRWWLPQHWVHSWPHSSDSQLWGAGWCPLGPDSLPAAAGHVWPLDVCSHSCPAELPPLPSVVGSTRHLIDNSTSHWHSNEYGAHFKSYLNTMDLWESVVYGPSASWFVTLMCEKTNCKMYSNFKQCSV